MENTAKRTRAQYPYVVEPLGSQWQVLYVRSDPPVTYLVVTDRARAFAHMRNLNREWWLELHAGDAARHAIDRARETAALQHASTARASFWTRLKALLRLR